jgi:hypothetical protein
MHPLSRLGVALAVLAAAVPALAQDSRGRVQGTIIDTSGGAMPGVSVRLQNDATGITVTRTTGSKGHYLFDQVDPGTYTIEAELSGFAKLVQKNVRVPQRGDVTADLTLQVSEVQEVVTVEGSPIGVQFNTAARDLTVDETLIKELPLSTRNPATLALLDPSVNGDFNRNSNIDHYAANAYDIGGQTKGQNDILIDGSPLANSAKLAYNPPIEAVSEYTVLQNAVDAEFGHSAGGIVTMSMKSGSNQVQGSAYYFGGDPDWNAWTDRIRRQHSQNTFWNGGATLGMPLKKNKLFLFSAFEKQTDTSFRPVGFTLPTARERAGDFSESLWTNGRQRVIYDPLTSRIEGGRVVRDPFPGNIIPRERWDPLAARLLQNLWNPNSPGDDLTGLNNFKADWYLYYRYWNLTNRVDWQINDKWKAFARASIFRTDQPDSDFTNGADKLKMRRNEGSQRDGTNFAFDTIYTVNPSTVVSLAASYYKTIDRRNYPEYDIGEAGYRDLWPSGWWQPYLGERPIIYFPNIQVLPNADIFGVRNFWWQQPLGTSASLKLNKYFSQHSVKAGTNVRWKRGNAARFYFTNMHFTGALTRNTTSGADTSTGNPWADFLLGVMDSDIVIGGSQGRRTGTEFIPLQEANTEMYAVYVQDDFKVNSKLTLNMGLRYEYEGGYWDSQHRLPQRLDLNDPIPGMQSRVAPGLAATPAGNTGKTVAQLMAESAGQKSHVFNGAFYYTEPDNKRATSSQKDQIMPRVGLAYRLDDKTAFRAGYGRFYTPAALSDPMNEPLGQFDLGSGFAPFTDVLPPQEGRPQAFLNNPFPQGLTPVVGKAYGRNTALGDTINIDEYQRRPPVSDRITVSLQREVFAKTVVDVTYLVNFTDRVSQTVNLNMFDPRLSYRYGVELSRQVPNPFFNYGSEADFPGQLRRQPTVALSQLLRPYPQYQNINQTSTAMGKYRLHSLQFRLQRPFRNGVSFIASYAYNREKSEMFYDDVAQYDRTLAWQDTTNPRHRVVVAATAELPFGRGRRFASDMPQALEILLGGWQFSGVYSYRSGQFLRFSGMVAPESVRKIGDVGRNGFWFDTTGFSRLPAFTRRSNPLQYDNLTGPSFKNLDATLSKSFTLPRDSQLEFRLEAYNAFNQLIWANPNTNIASSDFGKTIFGANSGRRLQYAVRFQF